MYHKIAVSITSALLGRAENQPEDTEQEVIVYGFELLIASVITFLLVLLLGLMFRKGVQTLIFMLFYCPLRRYSGGYHAGNYRNCTAFFLSMYGAVLLMSMREMKLPLSVYESLVWIAALAVIWILAPVDTENKRLGSEEKKSYRLRSRKIVLFESTVILLFYFLNMNAICRFAAAAMIMVSGLLAVGAIKEREVVCGEKKRHNGKDTD